MFLIFVTSRRGDEPRHYVRKRSGRCNSDSGHPLYNFINSIKDSQQDGATRPFVFGIYMASYDYGKIDVVNYVYQNFAPDSICLDVGACDGKWHDLLGHYLIMDAVEIFAPNIKEHRLKDKYRRVWECDVYDFKYDWYDLIIFGDVIEHMTIDRAQRVLEYARGRCRDMIIGVPFNYPQDAIYGNPYEEHIQPDLTDEIFRERYPGFELLCQPMQRYAYYHIGDADG